MSERTIFIGDVHGCFEELQLLLEKVEFNKKKDRLIFLGDLINKGPFSREVVAFVRGGGHECILGNHELGFLRSLKDPSYFKRGFKKFYESMEAREREEVIEWIENLPLYIEEKDFICIHGGLEPDVPLAEQNPRVATRIRTWGGDVKELNNPDNPPWHKFYEGEKPIIYGHWAMQGLWQTKNTFGMDSGCVWGNHLSALIWPVKEIVQVKALKQYAEFD